MTGRAPRPTPFGTGRLLRAWARRLALALARVVRGLGSSRVGPPADAGLPRPRPATAAQPPAPAGDPAGAHGPGPPVVPCGRSVERKVDLAEQLTLKFGQHRSGLKYGLEHLKVLHNPGGVKLDAFIERTFVWCSTGVRPHRRPWIGFVHVPPCLPDWFLSDQANDVVMATPAWNESAPLCRGLFTFSEYHRDHLRKRLSIPVESLLLPTEIPETTWSWEAFEANPDKKVVQVGWWLRRLHAIYQLPESRLRKVLLDVGHPLLPGLLRKEREILVREGRFTDSMYDTAETIGFLANEGYDELLSKNVVLAYLYEASANNTVIECIARRTPILVNPLPAVREYLGADYPLYFETLEEAAAKASDFDLLHRAHRHLGRAAIQVRLTGAAFLEDFSGSTIYSALGAA